MAGLSVRTIQRAERGYPQSLETRMALAAVFEVDHSLFTPGAHVMTDAQHTLKSDEVEAMEYVQGIKAFYQHMLLYLFITLFFVGGIFLAHGFVPVYIQFTMVGWLMGLLFHWLNAFEIVNFFGPKWERRQIEKRLKRKL